MWLCGHDFHLKCYNNSIFMRGITDYKALACDTYIFGNKQGYSKTFCPQLALWPWKGISLIIKIKSWWGKHNIPINWNSAKSVVNYHFSIVSCVYCQLIWDGGGYGSDVEASMIHCVFCPQRWWYIVFGHRPNWEEDL